MERWYLPARINVVIYSLLLGGIITSLVILHLLFTPVLLIDQPYKLTVRPGDNLYAIASAVANDFQQDRYHRLKLLCWLAKLTKQDLKIQTGEYSIAPKTLPYELLQQLAQGQVIQYGFTIIEGWRFSDLRASLSRAPKITNSIENLTEAEIMLQLNDFNNNNIIKTLEGIFYPDTYYYAANTTDLEILLRAYNTMQQHLAAAWEQRATNICLTTPAEALVLASIIEKESNKFLEYSTISGVYQRRITKKMYLQADPTVRFGLAKAPGEPLTKQDLQVDNLYNSYKYKGLPPTAIAFPSLAAIKAAVLPAMEEEFLYFVADGSGGHIFSKTLAEHNRAVRIFRNSKR